MRIAADRNVAPRRNGIMPRKWLSCLMMSFLLLASVAVGCRAPYPTYNPYGFYGQPCINPPGTGTYNPATGRTDPYYGAPTNGVYPQNPYAPGYQYPGYPPAQPGVGSSTSQRTWSPQASSGIQPPTVESGAVGNSARVSSNEGNWKTLDNPNDSRTAMDAASGEVSPRVALNTRAGFDGFGRGN